MFETEYNLQVELPAYYNDNLDLFDEYAANDYEGDE